MCVIETCWKMYCFLITNTFFSFSEIEKCIICCFSLIRLVSGVIHYGPAGELPRVQIIFHPKKNVPLWIIECRGFFWFYLYVCFYLMCQGFFNNFFYLILNIIIGARYLVKFLLKLHLNLKRYHCLHKPWVVQQFKACSAI